MQILLPLLFAIAPISMQDGYLPPPQDPFITVNMWDSHGMEHVYAIPVGDPFEYAEIVNPDSQAFRGMGNGGSDVSQWAPLVAGQFPPGQVDMALAIMRCESGGNPDADNPRSSARGLFQVLASLWAPYFGFTYEDLYVPELNVYAAARIWEMDGWNAWSCYRKVR